MNENAHFELSGEKLAIEKAIRNRAILDWLRLLPRRDRLRLMVRYAQHLTCPVCEITEDFTDAESLEWIWSQHREEIERACGK